MFNGIVENIKWSIFVILNRLSDLVSKRKNPRTTQIYDYTSADSYIWVFCSTLGEVNACKPFIDHLHGSGKQLVLLTDRYCYYESYKKYYPDAIVVELTGEVMEPSVLIKKMPPETLYVSEIPCKLHDAPCRLSYSLLRSVKKSGKPIYLVNGWLYGYKPGCRMDSIELSLFHREYINAFNKVTVQTEEVRDDLIKNGADPEKVVVTGNMKFDAMSGMSAQPLDQKSEEIIKWLSSREGVVITAGCLASLEETKIVVSSIEELIAEHNNIFVVLGPRHPENRDFMAGLDSILKEFNVPYTLKSTCNPLELASYKILILDSIGELRAYFNSSDICYMGQNHNLLEPLAFEKPTITLNNWDQTYPSYPVYNILKEHELITISKAELLSNHLSKLISKPSIQINKLEKLRLLSGSVEKNIKETS